MATSLALRLLYLLLLFSGGAYGANQLPASCSTPLPDPAQANGFLHDKYSNWTNPVLGRPLQVIKCRAVSGNFDFYQVEALQQACNQAPPLVNVVHREPVNVIQMEGSFVWMLWLGQLMLYLGQVIAFLGLVGGGFLVVTVASIVVTYVLGIFWGAWFWLLSRSGLVKEDIEVNMAISEGTGDDAASSLLEKNASEHAASEVLKKGAGLWKSCRQRVCTLLLGMAGGILGITTLLVCALAALGLLAAIMGPVAAAVCWNTNLSVERTGPVRLPDPNEGLNQHLNLALELCTTPNLQFYVACSGEATCEQLGEPYGDLLPVGEPFKGPWEVKAGCPAHLGPLHLHVPISLITICCSFVVFFFGLCIWADIDEKRRKEAANDSNEQTTSVRNAPTNEQGGLVADGSNVETATLVVPVDEQGVETGGQVANAV